MIAVAVAALTLPAGAQAATVTTDKACYRAGEEGTVTVGGFRAASTVDATVEGQPMVNLLPDGAGGASAPFTPLASPATGDVAETLIATDANLSPVLTAQTTYRVTATSVTMTPSRASSSATVTWRLAGFGLGTAYLHVARRNAAGRTVTVKTLRLGTLTAPCGGLTVRTKQLPLSRPEAGRVYELRFSTTRSTTATALVKRSVRAPAARKRAKATPLGPNVGLT
jgi:hypothetical protein